MPGEISGGELPAEGRHREAPELPGEDWLESTIEWWEKIWASPMATIWEPADVDGLHRLAQLRDAQHRGELPVSALGAIQALEDRYGLNPKARRMLQWEIKRGEVVDHPTRQGKPQRKLRAIEA